ncbi:pentapeptide repeat-containing protein [Nostoc sp.]
MRSHHKCQYTAGERGFSGVSLRRVNLRGSNFSNIDFSGADIYATIHPKK